MNTKLPEDDSVTVGFFRRLLSRPITVLMVVLAMIGTSLIAAMRIPIEMMPSGFADGSIVVVVPWAGANPNEVEQRIVKPLEEELGTLTGVSHMHAVSSEGMGRVILQFPGTFDMDEAYAEVADRVERVRPKLPREADRVTMRRWTAADTPVLWCGVLYPGEIRDRAQEIFSEVLQPRLEAIDGVAAVNMNGLEPRSVRILLDEEQVKSNRVDIGALVRRLQSDNISAPVGDLDEAGSRYIVRIDGRFQSLEEIEDFPVRPGLRLGEIGRVIQVRSAPDDFFRVNGRYGLGVSINKETSANTFEVCQRLTEVIEKDLPADPVLGQFEYSVFWNEGETVETSLRNLIEDAVIGGAIACAVLMLFLRRLRFTMLIALSIPFSVLATLIWLYFSGDSFNLFSMMGITISIGMLVDNSVVIVESIFQRREQGQDLQTACTKGPADMVLAVVTATLTTVVVFLPLIFMSEDRNARVFTTSIGVPLCVALMSALVLAIIIVPVASRYLIRGGHRRRAGGQSKRRRPLLPWLDGMKNSMPRLVAWSLNHRFAAATLALAFLFSGQLASAGNQFDPTSLSGFGGQLTVQFEFSSNTDLYQAEEEVLQMEETLMGPLRQEIGNPDIGVAFNRNGGEIYLWHETDVALEEREAIFASLEQKLPKSARTEFKFEGSFSKQNVKDEEWLRIQIEGPESQRVQAIAAQVRELARQVPEFEEIAEDQQAAREILVNLDRERMQQVGTSSVQVLGIIEWALRGTMISRFETARGDVPIIMEFDEEENPDRNRLQELAVAWFGSGAELPLSNFALFEHRRSPDSIYRKDGQTMEVVGIKPEGKNLQRNAAMLNQIMNQVEMPEGYRWNQEGGWTGFQEDMKELQQAFTLAVVLVFFLMGLLFESLILPFSVLITIAFAVVGAQWAFRLTGQPVDLVGMIGMIVLAGVVVNNGIVLVDRILRLQGQGLNRAEAVVQGVRDRIRPVLMTAATTITGLLPIALSEPQGNSFSFKSLAIGVSGGLAITTFFTLWVVPLLYTLLEDLGNILSREVGQRLLGRYPHKNPKPTPAATAMPGTQARAAPDLHDLG
ncbi:MAG: AcrB/AcrD/AcrF family protein [Planctomycetota bacterium]|nr:MAG: AcrB/AcrD/AcrF family protein [Planctomycetota bacterium]